MKKKLLLAAAVPVLGSVFWMSPNAAACGNGSQNLQDDPATLDVDENTDDITVLPEGTTVYLGTGDTGGNNGYVGAESADGSYVELDGQTGNVIEAGDGTSASGLAVSDEGDVCTPA